MLLNLPFSCFFERLIFLKKNERNVDYIKETKLLSAIFYLSFFCHFYIERKKKIVFHSFSQNLIKRGLYGKKNGREKSKLDFYPDLFQLLFDNLLSAYLFIVTIQGWNIVVLKSNENETFLLHYGSILYLLFRFSFSSFLFHSQVLIVVNVTWKKKKSLYRHIWFLLILILEWLMLVWLSYLNFLIK